MLERETRIKICGLQDEETALFTAEAGADFLGFVFVPEHRYYIKPVVVKGIVARLKSFGGGIVGVFVDEEVKRVNEIIELCSLAHVQLHGNESPEYCCMIRGAQVIKALRVGSQFTTEEVFKRLTSYDVDLYVLDRIEPGKGELVELSLAQQVAEEYPIFLAGGINPENVEQAIRAVRPFGVDVASGVEANDIKDFKKIKNLIQAVRSIR